MRAWIAIALLAAAAAAAGAELRIEAARTAAPPPGAGVVAGYFTAHNTGTDTIRITGARSPRFDRVTLHRTEHDDGTARMAPVDAVSVEPGAAVRFEPGGLHLMMFAPEPAPEVGETVTVELVTSTGTVPVRLEVVPRAELLEDG